MDYANPDALASTEWLADNLADPGIKVLDASYFLPTQDRDAKAEYAEKHIAGAVFFDVDDVSDHSVDLPHMLPDAETFAAKIGALGIGNDDKVVAYDSTGGAMAAARAWWTFRVFGHDDVAVLNGGLPRWLAEGRPVTAEVPAPEAKTFRAVFRPELVRSLDQMRANVENRTEQVADARSHGRFKGAAPEPRPGLRAGHIPGSVCLPFPDLMDPDEDQVMRGANAIAEAFADAGIDIERPVVATCGSGVTAAMLAFGLHLIGKEDVAVYDGSWSEWGGRDDTPVET